MHRVLLLGAGKIGRAIAKLLGNSGDYYVLVGDVDDRALARVAGIPNVSTRKVDVATHEDLLTAMNGRQSVLSACSFAVNPGIARAALASGASYFDLTEDVETTRAVAALAKNARAGQIFMPQCGLAPGFISIAGHHLTKGFEKLDASNLVDRPSAVPLMITRKSFAIYRTRTILTVTDKGNIFTVLKSLPKQLYSITTAITADTIGNGIAKRQYFTGASCWTNTGLCRGYIFTARIRVNCESTNSGIVYLSAEFNGQRPVSHHYHGDNDVIGRVATNGLVQIKILHHGFAFNSNTELTCSSGSLVQLCKM
jgi:hypothetical protein